MTTDCIRRIQKRERSGGKTLAGAAMTGCAAHANGRFLMLARLLSRPVRYGPNKGVIMIKAGDTCPDFALPDDRGATVTLASLRGSPFVLFFYPKDDTSGCTQEALAFSQLSSEFDAIGVRVVGVSPDPVKSHAKFRDKHELKVSLLSDEAKTLLEAAGVWAEKSMYGRKYMGVERTTILVDARAAVAEVWPKVKVAGHADAVLASAREVAGKT
jgi:thioredoxin-dependent peroxiredoxin